MKNPVSLKELYIPFFIFLVSISYSQHSPDNSFFPGELRVVVLMQPTGNTINDLPEMILVSDTSSLHEAVMNNIDNSFVNDFINMYFIAQVYLNNMGKWDSIEPAYLALTQNQGGFAKTGFTILNKEGHIDKPLAPYIDITVGQATASPDKLMSFSQLYPHEMGHVLFHLLSPEDSISNNTKNVDMHFFSIITDYSTAFNEGFAEHIENVSRTYERNHSIKEGIKADLKNIEANSERAIKGFERDFKYPFRLGYFKASMLNWYQKYEDFKRHHHAFSGDIRYKNNVINTSDIEDQLTFRNSGVGLNKDSRRNLVQLCATEGAVSAFFTHLSTSDLKDRYLDPKFYQPFLYEMADDSIFQPELIFTPLQNQFIKYFFIFYNNVTFNNSDKSQLIDFIEGYIKSFPEEENKVKEIFKESLGMEYTNELPPSLWILVKDYSHRLLVFDPFDAITLPIYTFDLNATEKEDLLTIKGINKETALAIVNYRESNGFFTSMDELMQIPGIPKEQVNKVIDAKFEDHYFEESLSDFEQNLSINALILAPLKHIFIYACFYFVIVFALIYFILIRGTKTTLKKLAWIGIKYFLLWNVIVFSGLFSVLLMGKNASLAVITIIIFVALISILLYRKRKIEMKRSILFLGMTLLVILFSVF